MKVASSAFLLLATFLALSAQNVPPSAPLEIRVYVLDDQRRPFDLTGWQALLEIGDRLDGAHREVLPMVRTQPSATGRLEGPHPGQIRPINGGPWSAEMVVIDPGSPDPLLANHSHGGPYFRAEYSPGDRFKPQWTATVTFDVKGELKTARNFRYPFLEAARGSADGRTMGAALPLH